MTNKGGRGKKAPYQTTHSRIPDLIKNLVDSISESYKQYVDESGCLDFDEKNLLPSIPAIYLVFNESEILYIGQTKNLSHRWKSHHLCSDIQKISKEEGTIKIAWLNYHDFNSLTGLEKLLIEGLQPKLNLMVFKDEKQIRTKLEFDSIALEEENRVLKQELVRLTGTNKSFDREQVRAIVSEALSAPTSRGGYIKECLAQLGNLLGFQIERGEKNKWIIFDTSD